MPRKKATGRANQKTAASKSRNSSGNFTKRTALLSTVATTSAEPLVTPESSTVDSFLTFGETYVGTANDSGDFGFDFDSGYDDFETDLVAAFDTLKTCKDNSGDYLRALYTGKSRWTKMRENQRKEARTATMVGSPAITSYFAPSSIAPVTAAPSDDKSDDGIEETKRQDQQQQRRKLIDIKDRSSLEGISRGLVEAIADYDSTGQMPKSEKAHLMRLFAVKSYVDILCHGNVGITETSMKAAKMTYKGQSPGSNQWHRGAAIRKWAEQFVKEGTISPFSWGKHIKTLSILSSEEMKIMCLEWLKSQKPMDRDLRSLKTMIDSRLGSPAFTANQSLNANENENGNGNGNGSQPVLKEHTSLTTIRLYLKKWGVSFRKNTKGIYFDGHERPDVIEYRREWATRMMGRFRCMSKFEGEHMEIEIEPETNGKKKFVMVTHDVSIFYANDGKEKGWFLPNEIHLRGKGPGLSIMVSEFQCVCHGTVSRRKFLAGANREGYWTHEDVVRQLREDAIPRFKALHPDDMGLFLFDQSSNHKAYAADALVASRMNRNPHIHPKDKVCFRNPSFYEFRDGKKRRADGTFKKVKYFRGVKAILTDRGLWHDDDRTKGREGKPWRLFCGENSSITNNDNTECCARHCLANQDDFKYQPCAIKETLHKAHLLSDFYPKFHCETNWIERYWSDVKRYARSHCDYSFAGLQITLENAFAEAALQNGIPTKLRRYYMRCWRYIDAYSRNLDAEAAEADVCSKFRNSQYKSHRRLAIED
ncbi:hypothetical protein [Absidia glauca]|uniref:Uncharacterized protein n=1 Tax=Absidia glauca TaxID=4829 RepID=A0A168PDF6_ABSGL|nr:hypothetical protein [Absidia glauca]